MLFNLNHLNHDPQFVGSYLIVHPVTDDLNKSSTKKNDLRGVIYPKHQDCQYTCRTKNTIDVHGS